MNIVIAGGTGFVGKRLSTLLVQQGHKVIILTRNSSSIQGNIQYVQWLDARSHPEEHLENVDAFVNLAGVSLNEGRWTSTRKKAIYNSRIDATNEIIRIIEKLSVKPKVLFNASAVGIYPISTTETYTEDSKNFANDFLGMVVQQWEHHAEKAKKLGVRVVLGRFGVILGKESGALPLMALPYKLFAGGTVGSGKQWLSWIHVEDVARAILHAITHEAIAGPMNVTAPNPMRMREFGQTIGKVLGRPHWMPVPGFAMKLALGEQSQLVLEGQRVLPNVLLQNQFEFKYPTLEQALKEIY